MKPANARPAMVQKPRLPLPIPSRAAAVTRAAIAPALGSGASGPFAHTAPAQPNAYGPPAQSMPA